MTTEGDPKPSMWRRVLTTGVDLAAQAWLRRAGTPERDAAAAPAAEAASQPPDDVPVFADAVKLLHSSELTGLSIFPRYQDHAGMRYGDYLRGRRKVRALWARHRELLGARRRCAELDSDERVVYADHTLAVPAVWWPRTLRLALPPVEHAGTVITADHGKRDGETWCVRARWRSSRVALAYHCERRQRDASELATLRQRLDGMSDAERADLAEIDTSRYRHPVLFISHRWDATQHPDPDGTQLARLRVLQGCYLVYDYSAFPQAPRSADEQRALDGIFAHMGELLGRVVILGHPDYMTRGWCLYEYIGSSLMRTVVCDELRDDRLVRLRDWAASDAPAPVNPWHDGFESLMSNYIQESVLHAVNGILPAFKASRFTQQADAVTVRNLLVALLKRHLPGKRSVAPETGIYESSTQPWTDKELRRAFESELRWPALRVHATDSFRMDVPVTLEQAVAQRYRVTTHPSSTYRMRALGNPLEAFAQALRDAGDDAEF